MTDQPLQPDIAPWALVNVSSQAALLTDIRTRLTRKTGFGVATLNLDHVVKLRQGAAFRQAYGRHSHITADGRPIVWLSRLAGHDIDLVTGSDLVDPLARLCAETGTPLAFVGATEPVLEAATAFLTARHPGLAIVARIAPPMGFDPENAEAVIADIIASGAGLCLLALGAPKQEILAARLTQAHPDIGVVSIGAGLDFLAGTQVRAPKIMRAMALEWLWRLIRSPRRLGLRYAACAGVLPGLVAQAFASRRGGSDAAGVGDRQP